MANPTRSDVHVNRPLSSIAVATIQSPDDFVHMAAFPNVPVQKQSDRYFVYTRDYWFRSGAQKRAPATESAGSGFHIDNTPNYFCDKWAFHMDVDDDTRQNADDPIDLDRDATQFIMQNLMIRREKLFVARYMSAGVWGGHTMTNGSGVQVAADFTPDVQWDQSTSNPMADIAKLKTGIKRITAMTPNVMIVSHDVNEALKENPLVLDRIKYTQEAIVTEQLLARLFGVDKYLVASAVENLSQEGQTAQYQFMISNKILLMYAAPAPGILKPSAGYIFSWSGLYGGSAYGSRMKTMRMEHLAADRVEGEMAFDMHMVSADLGVLGVNILSTGSGY